MSRRPRTVATEPSMRRRLRGPRMKRGRLLSAVRSGATGAIAGQLSQALASFVLQVIAARELGAKGLGVFALLYSCILLGAAVVSGFVGDTLVVLDRSVPSIRGALQVWCVLLSSAAGLVAAVGAHLAGLIDWTPAIVFGVASVIFMVESIMRRLLMAVMRFWALPIVDMSSLAVSVAVIGVWYLDAKLTLSALLYALLAGQAAGAVVAVYYLPAVERRIVSLRGLQMAAVAGYGFWRGTQQAVRPSMLTAARAVVTVAVGATLYGQLEAARVYMAPALLLISGMGGYLLPSYAAARDRPAQQSLHRADRFASLLLVGSLALGALGTAAVPVLGPLITGHAYHIEALAVFGWAVYAASTAAVLPYGTLAAVRASQIGVVALRIGDSILSVGFAWAALFVLHMSPSWTPFALAAGSFIGGALVRQLLLVPLCASGGIDAPTTEPVVLA